MITFGRPGTFAWFVDHAVTREFARDQGWLGTRMTLFRRAGFALLLLQCACASVQPHTIAGPSAYDFVIKQVSTAFSSLA